MAMAYREEAEKKENLVLPIFPSLFVAVCSFHLPFIDSSALLPTQLCVPVRSKLDIYSGSILRDLGGLVQQLRLCSSLVTQEHVLEAWDYSSVGRDLT